MKLLLSCLLIIVSAACGANKAQSISQTNSYVSDEILEACKGYSKDGEVREACMRHAQSVEQVRTCFANTFYFEPRRLCIIKPRDSAAIEACNLLDGKQNDKETVMVCFKEDRTAAIINACVKTSTYFVVRKACVEHADDLREIEICETHSENAEQISCLMRGHGNLSGVSDSRNIAKLFKMMSDAATNGANLNAFSFSTSIPAGTDLGQCKDLSAGETLTFLEEYVSGVFSAGGYDEEIYGRQLKQSLVAFEQIFADRRVMRCYRTVSSNHAFASYDYLKWGYESESQLVLMIGGED